MKRAVSAFLLALLLAGTVFGQEATAKAYLDRTPVVAGETFNVALHFEIAPGWHLYGNPLGPGTGKETVVTLEAPEGFRVGPARFSPPKRFEQPELGPGDWVWAYEKEATVYFEVTAPEGAPAGKVELAFAVDALACLDACVPQEFFVRLELPIAPAGTKGQPLHQELFAGKDQALEPAAPPRVAAPPAAPGPALAPGIPLLTEEQALAEIEKFSPREADEVGGLWWAVLFGFIAGLILNVMPCVLPVISIKVLSFVQQAGEDRARVFHLGLAFAGGILFVFLILAGLAALAGQSWGEQFQSTTFLIAMIVLVFAFALAMFDLYSIELPGFVASHGGVKREGLAGSFAKGMLATVLATPCSGPFLGSTLAWALKQPPAVVFLIFTSIGLGMALPYVVLTANPAFLKIVPRPGDWMVRFKELMGFVLLATAVYLLSILPTDQVVWVVFFCLFIALGAWIYGKVTGPWKPKAHRVLWRSVALAVILSGGWLSFGVLQPLYAPEGSKGSASADTLISELVHHLRAGRNVVVDWTADWCPNCKVVEKLVLESEAVQQKFAEKGVVFLVADITRKRPLAEALRDRLGSRSIPFLGIFSGAPAERYRPWTLRDMYSRSALLEILDELPQ